MYRRETNPEIRLVAGITDFRCGINSLSSKLVSLGEDPFADALYVFCNRTKDSIKVLYWGGSGFWLMQYRLEEGKFRWLKGTDLKDITYKQAEWLLDGLDIEQKHYIKEVDKRLIN